MKPIVWIDMDGVLADFNKEYTKYDKEKADRKKFREAVLSHKIFEKLDPMPDAHELLNHVRKLHGINVEILTSMGTHEPMQAEEAKKQNYELIKNDYKHNDYKNNDINGTVKHDEKKNIFLENINYLKFSKIVFLTSVIGGIGLTLGIKIGRIIFY